jgi:hypothetical protein
MASGSVAFTVGSKSAACAEAAIGASRSEAKRAILKTFIIVLQSNSSDNTKLEVTDGPTRALMGRYRDSS